MHTCTHTQLQYQLGGWRQGVFLKHSSFSVLFISLSTSLLSKTNTILRQSNLKVEMVRNTFPNSFVTLLFWPFEIQRRRTESFVLCILLCHLSSETMNTEHPCCCPNGEGAVGGVSGRYDRKLGNKLVIIKSKHYSLHQCFFYLSFSFVYRFFCHAEIYNFCTRKPVNLLFDKF